MPTSTRRQDDRRVYRFKALLHSNETTEGPHPSTGASAARPRVGKNVVPGQVQCERERRWQLFSPLLSAWASWLLSCSLRRHRPPRMRRALFRRRHLWSPSTPARRAGSNRLPGLQADQATPHGDPRCEGNFALLPLQRSTATENEDLVAVFQAGPDNGWEHFATVRSEDCADLSTVADGFPTSLCVP